MIKIIQWVFNKIREIILTNCLWIGWIRYIKRNISLQPIIHKLNTKLFVLIADKLFPFCCRIQEKSFWAQAHGYSIDILSKDVHQFY